MIISGPELVLPYLMSISEVNARARNAAGVVIYKSQPKSLSETNIAIMFALLLAASGQQVSIVYCEVNVLVN